ncbi:MAG: hypothetical protein WGN25_15405 [Candidatus Electrothrix sp. GW3-4]|uniref:hypothetical protein n=1 Tax=Candidatus Electrothrix sp. GW3-4 TaxID=3126740 RepID=UPI0030CB5D28
MPIITEPNGTNDICNNEYEIHWIDGNNAGESISLFYDTDNQAYDGTLIIQDIPAKSPDNTYHWNISNIANGKYYIYITVKNDTEVRSAYSSGPVTIVHNKRCLDVPSKANLLPNPSFEEGILWLASWQVKRPFNRDRSWGYKWINDPKQAHTGSRSIKISNTFNGFNSDSAWRDRVKLNTPKLKLPTAGGKYVLSAWIKTRNVKTGHVLFRVKYFDKKGEQLPLLGHGTETFFTGGPQTGNWTQVAFLLNTPHWGTPPYPARARAEKIQLNFSLDNSPGILWVDDVSLVEINDREYEHFYQGNRFAPPAMTVNSPPLLLPRIDGWSATVQQDPKTGVWWFVGPDHRAFWATGIVIDYNDKLLATTGLSDKAYKQEAQYRSRRDLNFNQGWRDKSASGKYSLVQNNIIWLNFSTEPAIDVPPEKWVLKDRKGNLIAGYGHYFPDVFSPVWQQHAVREAASLLADDGRAIISPQVLGYWTDNEMAYGDIHDFLWGDTCQLAFIDWLQGKNDLPSVDASFRKFGSKINLNTPSGFELTHPYTSIKDLNKSWSSNRHRYRYKSFIDISSSRDKPFIRGHNDPVRQDLYAFERVIYKIYVDTIIENIRRAESQLMADTGRGFHHPIFSNRFHLNRPAALEALRLNMDIFNRFDIIAINLYPPNQSGMYIPREWINILKTTFYTPTAVPIYIAEFGVAGEDADNFTEVPYLMVARWREMTVKTQYQRGWAYKNLVSTWVNLPYIIGANWFKWSNGYGSPKGVDVRNCGIVDDQDTYYRQFTDNIRSVNKQVTSVFRSGTFSVDDINWKSIDIDLCETEQ